MGEMLADAFRRRVFGFTFEPLPQLVASGSSRVRRRSIVARCTSLSATAMLIIAEVDLGTRFLRGPP